jgi:hypothetical protein
MSDTTGSTDRAPDTPPAKRTVAAKKSAAKKTVTASAASGARKATAKPATKKATVPKATARKGTARQAVSESSATPAERHDAPATTATTTAVHGAPAARAAEPSGRLAVRKTYKLFVGGKFPRSESGRSYQVTSSDGTFLGHAALASRKDARDAVQAARAAVAGWSAATAYNRGQVLYRIAEMLEGRREQFAAEIASVEGGTAATALAQVDAAVDRWVWYAGWADKISQILGAVNPVAGPFWNVSSPTPTGVVATVAPQSPTLLGLVSVTAPAIVSGNAVVVVAPEASALPAISFAEVLATSDLPGGVLNVLTGRVAELLDPLATHQDVNALDLSCVADVDLALSAERDAAESLKRVCRPLPGSTDWHADPDLDRMRAFLETRTVWHPVGR